MQEILSDEIDDTEFFHFVIDNLIEMMAITTPPIPRSIYVEGLRVVYLAFLAVKDRTCIDLIFENITDS